MGHRKRVEISKAVNERRRLVLPSPGVAETVPGSLCCFVRIGRG
jgi:hypothetical protein